MICLIQTVLMGFLQHHHYHSFLSSFIIRVKFARKSSIAGYILYVVCNGDWTECSTVQEVIGQVIWNGPNQKSGLIWYYEKDYPKLVSYQSNYSGIQISQILDLANLLITSGGTWPMFGNRAVAEGLKPWPCLRQEKAEKHLPCLGQHPSF